MVVLGSVAYLGGVLHTGWVPHDTGQLGQTAERVLSGQMQHRDFDEPYTGGLGCLHALAFELLGVRAESIRWVLLVYFSLFVAAVYLIALRVSSPVVAGAVAFLCTSLSVPLYAEGLPSWYNLFFAVWGTLALLQHIDTGQRRWLFWAGCCAGCSLVMKITGLYFVAAGLLYIACREQQLSRAAPDRSPVFSGCLLALYAAFASLGGIFLRGAPPLVHGVHFTLPLVAVALYPAWHEWWSGRGAWPVRVRALLSQLVPYGLGVAAVTGMFLAPHIATGSLDDLYRGLFVLPAARLTRVALAPPDLRWMCLSLPVAGLLLIGQFRGAVSLDRPRVVVAVSGVMAALFAYTATASGYFLVFQMLRNLIPGVVVVGVGVLLAQPRHPDRLAVYLLLAVTALCSLVQYPYAYGTYFFFVAPLMVVAALYVVAWAPWVPKMLCGTLLAFAIALAVVRLPQPDPRLLNGHNCPDFPTATLDLARCGFRVYAEDARVYQELVSLICAHTLDGQFIYAAPDCPEVYFLSGRGNPTRTFYELFDQSAGGRRVGAPALRYTPYVDLVVVNHAPAFTPPLDDTTLAALRAQYPHQRVLYGSRRPGVEATPRFTVLWRAAASPRPCTATSPAGRRATGCVGYTECDAGKGEKPEHSKL